VNGFHFSKCGLVYSPSDNEWTHASHPCVAHYKEDVYVVAFTRRDSTRKSHIFLAYAQLSNSAFSLITEPKHVLAPGAPGHFDCDGVISGCFVELNGECLLYYVGWQNLPDGLWMCDTGVATLSLDNLTATRLFDGPVLGRDRTHPLFVAATAFAVTPDNLLHCWYNSGISWQLRGDRWHHKYGLHHAVSENGIDWKHLPGMTIPFKDEYEYAFGRPSVVKWKDRYHMWFAHRASKLIDTYRIGYAVSEDCYTWDRDDELSGIDVSEAGWDSEMICYPSVFLVNGNVSMLYNGNGYGATGFGYAKMEDLHD
jgi:hypothetical protein